MKCKICVFALIIAFLPQILLANDFLVKQTEYNCIPAAIEMCYRILGEYDITQAKIRRDMNVPDGPIYVNDMEHYLNENFTYEEQYICCMDSLENAIGDKPVLVVLDMKKLNMSIDYNGHALVATEIKKDEFNTYIKVLDPDGGRESWYSLIDIFDAIKGWNRYVYIIDKLN